MAEIKLRRFRALIDENGLDDGGVASFTFKVIQLEKGKVYTEYDRRVYDESLGSINPFFIDDNNCSRDIVQMLKEKKIEEVF